MHKTSTKPDPTPTRPPIIEVLATLIKDFEKTQSKYKAFGANDTEPDGIFQRLIADTVEGRQRTIPATGHDWELYASSMDCTEAAKALYAAAELVVKNIELAPIRDLAAIKQFIRGYCWRIY